MNQRQGNLENTILNAVWSMEEGGRETIDVSDVQNTINTGSQGWAYTTVKTVLDRLVEKGLVTRLKEGKKYYYKTNITRIEAGQAAIIKLARQYYNGDIEELSKAVAKACNEMAVFVR